MWEFPTWAHTAVVSLTSDFVHFCKVAKVQVFFFSDGDIFIFEMFLGWK